MASTKPADWRMKDQPDKRGPVFIPVGFVILSWSVIRYSFLHARSFWRSILKKKCTITYIVMFSRRRKSHISELSVLEHSLSGLSALGRPLDTTDNEIGALGLNLLYAPPVPLIDFIFVHGLRGGSRKTWSKTSDPYHFWPKEWLSRDSEFKNVRIHSFGYNSDWGDGKDSVLNIHDFGKSLLVEIINSPEIRKDGDTPIVFIGHSMGGLVIKKTCILASQDPSTKSLADRIYGIVFLATPHRGTDSAALLNNILRASLVYSHKPFVSDLERNSGAIQSINDEFRHYSSALNLYSFYETMKTSVGVSSLLIVSKDSATLGYPNEQSALLNATHRGICKFDSPSDSNFISLRNALVAITRGITDKVVTFKREQYRSQLRELQEYLGVSEIPEDDLIVLEDTQLEGSCQWFTWKKHFQAWRDSHPGALPHYWLSAQPATGKSVIAAHVIRNLEAINANCSYYFFKHNDTTKVCLSTCLRSLAYQMALVNIRIRHRLLLMKDDGVRFDKNNELAIWRKLFLNGIFEVSIDRPHFWVVDALDECSSQCSIVTMLNKASGAFPLRLFMTSRPTSDIVRDFSQLENLVYTDGLTVDDTRNDIELYLRANLENQTFQDKVYYRKITETILEKSHGSFLWVVLVVKEMRSAFSESDIQQVLEEVPHGMDALYERALALMSQTNRGKHLIKAILLWTVCAIRPLAIGELEQALKLDTGETVLVLEGFIASNCGHLVHVDKIGRVSLVHETVRAFILRRELKSEFAVEKAIGHGRIADVCLQYLSSDQMKPPRSQKLMHMYHAKSAKRSPFVDYACLYFSQHLRRSHSEDTQRFIGLSNFLGGNVGTWIEYVARVRDLHCLTRTAKDLKSFLQARAKYHPPIGRDVQRVDNWQSDLIRLAAQFGRNLIECPSAIFWLIPPFCPPKTAIRAQFESIPHAITVSGLSAGVWSDRTSSIHYQERQTRAIAYADSTFAVGLSDKSINFYSTSTCQEIQQLIGTQPAKLLSFSSSGKLLAATSVHYVTLFNLDNGQRMWQTRLPQECLTLLFTDRDRVLHLVTKGGVILSFSVSDGLRLSLVALNEPSDEDEEAGFRRIYTSAAFSIELNMVAAVQRGRPIGLYDVEDGSFFGHCVRETDTEVERIDHALLWVCDFVFNPNPAINIIAALYHDGNLVAFDPCELAVRACVQADAQTLACSPDGHTLATGSATGTIQLFECESLNLLYRIVASDYSIRALVFSSDSLRFLDVRGSQCNIWEPSVLVYADTGETNSVSDTVTIEPTVVSITDVVNRANITTITCHPGGEYVFCGKENGSVALYSTTTGNEVRVLYQHAHGIAIKHLEHGSRLNILASADASSRLLVWRIIKNGTVWAVEGPLLDARVPEYSISQILLDLNNSRLLVSTIVSDTIYDIDGGVHTARTFEERASWKWINHPRDSGKLIHITATVAHLHTWNELSESHSSTDIRLASDLSTTMSVKDVAVCSDSCKFSVEFSKPYSQQSTSHVLILSASSFEEPLPSIIEPLPLFVKVSPIIEHLIGCRGRNLLFLDRRMWVCSLDLEAFKGEYYQHCFVPNEWLSANWKLTLKVTSKGDLVFVKGNEIAIIKRALDNKEAVAIHTAQVKATDI